MFRRTLLGMVAIASLLVVGTGSAFANPGWGGHHHHGGGYGYRGYGGYGYGGYGYRPIVVAPRPVIVPQPVVVPPVYGGVGCNTGYGYGGYTNGYAPYGAGYGTALGVSTPGFGFYMNR
jgi:hypothetical protein